MNDNRWPESEEDMSGEKALKLRSRVLEAAANDREFCVALSNDPKGAIENYFNESIDLDVRFHAEQPGEFAMVLPLSSELLITVIGEVEKHLEESGQTPSRGHFECLVVKKAWDDSDFRSRLLADPASVLGEEIEARGGNLPSDVRVTILEESPGECAIVLPAAHDPSAALSDEDLEAVAGGVVPIAYIAAVTVVVVGAVGIKIVSDVIDGDMPGAETSAMAIDDVDPGIV